MWTQKYVTIILLPPNWVKQIYLKYPPFTQQLPYLYILGFFLWTRIVKDTKVTALGPEENKEKYNDICLWVLITVTRSSGEVPGIADGRDSLTDSTGQNSSPPTDDQWQQFSSPFHTDVCELDEIRCLGKIP